MLKRIKLSMSAIILSLACSSSYANDLQNAFNALTNYTSPGVYNSQVRGFMTGGSFSVSFPQDQMNFINITPPMMNAGCGGISIFWGGISYISGQQFTAMLKGIAADSLGEAFSIAVRTLCPVCSTVLADLQKAAQAATDLSMNQCGAAMALLDEGINSVPSLRKYIKGQSSLDSGGSGQSGGFLSAFSKYTGEFQQSLQKRINDLQSITNPDQKQQALNKSPLGNSTWKYLNGMTTQQKNFIMSLVGTTIRTPYPTASSSKTVKQIPVAPTITPDNLAKLFMFGANATMNNKLYVLQCNKSDSLALWQCLTPQTVRIKDSYWYQNESVSDNGVSLTDYGFYGMAYGLMFQAIDNVSQGKPLNTPDTIILPTSIYGANVKVKTNFSTDEIKGFMTLAYMPLYRAVNIAAFYPGISKQLVANISEVVSAHYAIAYIDNYILNLKKTGTMERATGNQGLNGKVLSKLTQSIGKMRVNLNSKLTLLLSNLQTQEVWVNQVDQVQTTIYQQVMRNGLSSNYAYSLGLTGN